jgi:hypothetical protein
MAELSGPSAQGLRARLRGGPATFNLFFRHLLRCFNRTVAIWMVMDTVRSSAQTSGTVNSLLEWRDY